MAAIRARITRRHIDRDYPYQVEIVVPQGGLGTKLDQMHAWALERTLHVGMPTRPLPRSLSGSASGGGGIGSAGSLKGTHEGW